MSTPTLSRRDLLALTGGAALTLGTQPAPTRPAPTISPNDRINLAVIGVRGQGSHNAWQFLNTGEVNLVALCDVDERELTRVADACQGHGNVKEPIARQRDFRRLLDDPKIDAICVSTPDHWHAVMTVMGCQAGKHVYVEKPLSWCIAEGRAMLNAARRYNRVVQTGSQQRSGAHFIEAVGLVREGALGEVPFVRAWVAHQRGVVLAQPDSPPPDYVDYDLWLGPAPVRPFNVNRFHYNWHWWWDYGTGELGNWGAHMLDIARWGLGLDYPLRATASGGKLPLPQDCRETPDTQIVVYDYPGCTLLWEHRIYSQRSYQGMTYGAEFLGTEGTLLVDRDCWTLYQPDGKTVRAERGTSDQHGAHLRDFLACVRSGERPHADVEEGHITAVLCHLGNLSLRLGRSLMLNPATERFDNDAEANAMLTRDYRAPWRLDM